MRKHQMKRILFVSLMTVFLTVAAVINTGYTAYVISEWQIFNGTETSMMTKYSVWNKVREVRIEDPKVAVDKPTLFIEAKGAYALDFYLPEENWGVYINMYRGDGAGGRGESKHARTLTQENCDTFDRGNFFVRDVMTKNWIFDVDHYNRLVGQGDWIMTLQSHHNTDRFVFARVGWVMLVPTARVWVGPGDPPAVPLPPSLLLLGTGFLGLVGLRKKLKK
jgi:hypothetical protein